MMFMAQTLHCPKWGVSLQVGKGLGDGPIQHILHFYGVAAGQLCDLCMYLWRDAKGHALTVAEFPKSHARCKRLVSFKLITLGETDLAQADLSSMMRPM